MVFHQISPQIWKLHDKTRSTGCLPDYIQKFRRFIWKDIVYQPQALPFGLNVAPRVFTKLLKLVAAFLRKQGIRFVLYRNDMLTIGSKYQETALFTQVAIDLLTALSFNVHKETNSYGRRCISPHASSATGCARVSSTSGVESPSSFTATSSTTKSGLYKKVNTSTRGKRI